MRSAYYLVLSAIAAVAVADNPNAFNIPKGGYTFNAGEATTLKWKPTTDGSVSLKLQSGEMLTPDGGTEIASNIDNSGSYTWTPPEDIANEPDYTIEIVSDNDDGESNYLPRFSVSGATATESSTASSTATTASTSGASSTATSSSSVSSTSATTDASTTTSPSTMSTQTSTTNTSASASTTGASTTGASTTGASSTSSSSATDMSSSTASGSSTDAASSTGADSAAETASDTSAGVVNRVSGGLLAVALGAVAMM